MNIKDIIQGHWNELIGNNSDISENRLKICYSCPLYSSKLGGICNSNLWLNIDTEDISDIPKDGYKNGCGCRLRAKTKVPNEVCPLNKW